jgi:flavoprotein
MQFPEGFSKPDTSQTCIHCAPLNDATPITESHTSLLLRYRCSIGAGTRGNACPVRAVEGLFRHIKSGIRMTFRNLDVVN